MSSNKDPVRVTRVIVRDHVLWMTRTRVYVARGEDDLARLRRVFGDRMTVLR